MVRLLLWLLLIYIGYRVILTLTSAKNQEPSKRSAAPSEGTAAHRDPVCGMYVSEEDAVVGRLGNQRHFFCSMECLDKYREQLDHTSHS
jgi:YHS domain-containing protein